MYLMKENGNIDANMNDNDDRQISNGYLFENCCIDDSRYAFGSSYSCTANSNIRNGLKFCKFKRHHQLYHWFRDKSVERKNDICVRPSPAASMMSPCPFTQTASDTYQKQVESSSRSIAISITQCQQNVSCASLQVDRRPTSEIPLNRLQPKWWE